MKAIAYLFTCKIQGMCPSMRTAAEALRNSYSEIYMLLINDLLKFDLAALPIIH